MTLPRTLDHLGRKIYAHTDCRFKRCQQIAVRASDLEYSLARRYEELIDLLHPAVVGAPPTLPCIPLPSNRVPMGAPSLLVFHSRRILPHTSSRFLFEIELSLRHSIFPNLPRVS